MERIAKREFARILCTKKSVFCGTSSMALPIDAIFNQIETKYIPNLRQLEYIKAKPLNGSLKFVPGDRLLEVADNVSYRIERKTYKATKKIGNKTCTVLLLKEEHLNPSQNTFTYFTIFA